MGLKPNENYRNLKESYLFFHIAQKVEAYRKEHPELFPEVVEEEKPVKPSEVKIIEEEDEEVFEEKTELDEVEDEYADFYTEEELLQMKKQQEAARKKSKYKKKK